MLMLELMFYSSLASGEEMKAFATYSFTSKNDHHEGSIWISWCNILFQAGMLEGGERTPILNPVELEEIGSMLWSLPVTRRTEKIKTLTLSSENSPKGFHVSSMKLPHILVHEWKRYCINTLYTSRSTMWSEIYSPCKHLILRTNKNRIMSFYVIGQLIVCIQRFCGNKLP
ncbi:hypothetical protein OPV22_021406 [Ensete ventricosum]|uniref:Uncharacterized protein n=1 Tax=Ensete ventricosum TaxID=4639 RepID=A0AAV8QCY8_ENSVE|nr:hypothetical protein OPV22_021406 [Ensete ventricosum]